MASLVSAPIVHHSKINTLTAAAPSQFTAFQPPESRRVNAFPSSRNMLLIK